MPNNSSRPYWTPVSLTRRIAEATFGPLTIRRRLPGESGGAVLFVNGRIGGLRYLLKSCRKWDPQLLRIAALLARPGMCVWDVGANVGLFSRAVAFHAQADGLVVAMEPDFDAVTLLRRSCKHQTEGHASITILPVAVSDHCGFVNFDIAKRAHSSNAIHGFGSTQTGGFSESRTLPSVTLDHLLEHFRPPDVLKIDVEGAELEVLNGGHRIVTDVRPVIYCEVQRNTWLQILQLLEARGYRVWDGHSFGVGTVNAKATADTCDILAIPEEKLGEVAGATG